LLSTEERFVSTAPRPLLLVLAHGLRAADLGGLTAAEPATTTPVELTGLPLEPERFVLGGGDASGALWDLGIAVDRSNLTLRPRGRDDRTALENLRRRPTGPAPVTLISTTVARDIALGGGDPGRAVAEVDAFVAAVRDALRAGDRPEVWLVACGAVETAMVTFDFAGHYERRFAWPWRQELRATVTSEQVTIRAANHRALAHAAAQLQQPPFRGHGTLSAPTADTLRFAACPGVAFGRHRLAARPSLATTGAALVPDTGETLPATLPFAELLVRFWLRAEALHAPADAGEPRRAATTAATRAARPGFSAATPGA